MSPVVRTNLTFHRAVISQDLLRSREPSQPAISYEHIENFTKDLEVRRDLGNRASPVNRPHVKRPLYG